MNHYNLKLIALSMLLACFTVLFTFSLVGKLYKSASNETRGVVQAVIELAHVLELNVVAEGVKTEAQRKILTALGCGQMRGHLISRPLLEARFIKLLKNLSLLFE